MTAPAIDLTQYDGQKVLVQLGSADAELEKGTVVAATPQGIIFKPYGKSSADLKPSSEIFHIELQPVNDDIKARRVNPVTVNTVKRHLAERHGYKLEDVNAMTPEAAFEFHENTIDHSVLGHYHAEPTAKSKAEDEGESDAE